MQVECQRDVTAAAVQSHMADMNRGVRLATLCKSGYTESLFPYENIASLIHLMFLKPV